MKDTRMAIFANLKVRGPLGIRMRWQWPMVGVVNLATVAFGNFKSSNKLSTFK